MLMTSKTKFFPEYSRKFHIVHLQSSKQQQTTDNHKERNGIFFFKKEMHDIYSLLLFPLTQFRKFSAIRVLQLFEPTTNIK